MNPKISIITISYNNKEGLEKTLKSVTSQDYKDFEYIVIDGGSNDGSKEILEKYSDKINYWVSEPDKGIYNAMNKGIEAANGEYLLFLNSGDFLYSNTILEEISHLLKEKDIIYGNLEYFNDNKTWIYNSAEKLTFKHFINDTIPHPAAFIKKEIITKLGNYDENLKIVSDWKFFLLAICKEQVSYKKIDYIISKYDFTGISSNSNSFDLIKREKEATFEENFATIIVDYDDFFMQEKIIKEYEKSYNIYLKQVEKSEQYDSKRFYLTAEVLTAYCSRNLQQKDICSKFYENKIFLKP